MKHEISTFVLLIIISYGVIFADGYAEDCSLCDYIDSLTVRNITIENCENELEIGVELFKLPGINPPSETIINNNPVLLFDKNTNESSYVNKHIPLDYVPGTDYNFEFYWSASDDGAGNVVWCAKINCFSLGDDITTEGIESCVVSGANGDNILVKSPEITFSGTGVIPDMNCGIKVYRGASDVRDTYDNDAVLIIDTVYYESTCLNGEIY